MNKQISDTEIETEYMQICFFKTSTFEFSYLFAIIFRILLCNIIEILKTLKSYQNFEKLIKTSKKSRFPVIFKIFHYIFEFFIIYMQAFINIYICQISLKVDLYQNQCI